MNNEAYWKQREAQRSQKILLDTIESTNKALQRQYIRIFNDLVKDLMKIQEDIEAGKDLSISHYLNYIKYTKLLNKCQHFVRDIGKKETSILSDKFRKLYADIEKATSDTYDIKLPPLNHTDVLNVINSMWVGDGKMWSERIWDDLNSLSGKLENGLTDIFVRGTSPTVIVKEIQKAFGVSFSSAKRIVRTECKHIAFESTMRTYTKMGVSEWVWLTAKNEKVCPACQRRDMCLFKVGDETNIQPLHPNCVCGTLAYTPSLAKMLEMRGEKLNEFKEDEEDAKNIKPLIGGTI